MQWTGVYEEYSASSDTSDEDTRPNTGKIDNCHNDTRHNTGKIKSDIVVFGLSDQNWKWLFFQHTFIWDPVLGDRLPFLKKYFKKYKNA